MEHRSSVRPARRRRRLQVGIAGGLVVVAIGIGVTVATSGGDGSPGARAHAATPTVPTTLAPVVEASGPPPASVATTKVAHLEVFDAPGSTNRITSLSEKTDYQAQRTLLVLERQGDWLKTLLPIRPNGSTGWVRASDVELTDNPYRITINLTEHTVILHKDGEEILRSMAVVGSPRTPTPLGTFYITDPVDLRSSPNGAYGAFALGLSGFSEVLFEFNGGPGQIALHGTNQPHLVGQNVSNGCIRVPNDVIVEIAARAPLGTPVEIT